MFLTEISVKQEESLQRVSPLESPKDRTNTSSPGTPSAPVDKSHHSFTCRENANSSLLQLPNVSCERDENKDENSQPQKVSLIIN